MMTRNRGFGLFATVALATVLFLVPATAAYADNVAPSIVSAGSTTFTVGSLSDSFTVQTTGTPTPSISASGTLPGDLEFIDNGNGTATLDGTAGPGTAGTYPLTITATNGVAPDATQDFVLTVNPMQLSITSPNAATFAEGFFDGFAVQATGDQPISLSESGALPTGVTFTDIGNGLAEIEGPAAVGTSGSYPLTITASNGIVSDATQDFVLTVIPAPPNVAAEGECSGLSLIGAFRPALAQATPVVLGVKTAKAGTVVWGPGFGSEITTTGVGSCSLSGISYNDVQAVGKLAGVGSCDPSSTDPNLYPLNGKVQLRFANRALATQAYVRIVGFDQVAGPDVIRVKGMAIKGVSLGATVGGELFFDPIIKAFVNGEGGPIQGASPVLKGQFYFDNSQIVSQCASGGNPISTAFIGDGTSLLGSDASGLTFSFLQQ